jgi:hypothetical protein
MPRTAGAQLDAHEIDVYAIRGGRVAEARSMSIEPCATSAFYGRRVTRLSDPPAQFGLVGIRCHGGMAGKPPQPTNAIDLTGGDQTTAIWAMRLCGWMAVRRVAAPRRPAALDRFFQTEISVSGGLP